MIFTEVRDEWFQACKSFNVIGQKFGDLYPGICA